MPSLMRAVGARTQFHSRRGCERRPRIPSLHLPPCLSACLRDASVGDFSPQQSAVCQMGTPDGLVANVRLWGSGSESRVAAPPQATPGAPPWTTSTSPGTDATSIGASNRPPPDRPLRRPLAAQADRRLRQRRVEHRHLPRRPADRVDELRGRPALRAGRQPRLRDEGRAGLNHQGAKMFPHAFNGRRPSGRRRRSPASG